jgi:hypothetical protein
VEESSPVQIQRVLQIDLFDILIRRSPDSDHIERITVQVERMTQIRRLHLIYQHYLDDSIQWNIDLMGAHAVLSAVRGSVVSVAKLVWRYVVKLRQRRRRRKRERNLIDQTDNVVSSGGGCNCPRLRLVWGRASIGNLGKLTGSTTLSYGTYLRIYCKCWVGKDLQVYKIRNGKARKS